MTLEGTFTHASDLLKAQGFSTAIPVLFERESVEYAKRTESLPEHQRIGRDRAPLTAAEI